MNAWMAFWSGWFQTWRYWRMMAFLYLIHLCTGLVLVLLPSIQLIEPSRMIAIQEAAQGIPVWMVQELAGLLSNTAGMPVDPAQNMAVQELPSALVLGVGAVILAPFLAWFTGCFLIGGMTLVYSEAPHTFQWKRFFWGCWHWFAPFMGLSLVQVLFVLGVLAGGAWLAQATRLALPAIPGAGLLPIWGAGLLLSLGFVLFEYTRIVAVQMRTRNFSKAFAGALRFSIRYPFRILGFYFMAILLLLVVHIIFRLSLFPRIPLHLWPMVFVVQQGFVLGRLFLRGQRLAGGALLSNKSVDILPESGS
jgi:hypothetical protein